MQFYFGVDYYPEQWPEAEWLEAALLMAQSGFNVARLAEFAWAKMEPEEGCYDFDWLDRAIDVLASEDIRIVLGTPTASPPPWLMHKHNEIFRVREDGQRVAYGNRRGYCPNNPIYQGYSRQIVSQLAAHYAGHPAVIGWQIDNEFGERCYCPVCLSAFQRWLAARYSTLENLNEKWGTTFWSHVYRDWAEIPVPLEVAGSPNPGLALDFYRFVSDSYEKYQQMQIDILRANCPRHFITHNFMGFNFDRINYFDLARQLDFVSFDNYPSTQWNRNGEVDPSRVALSLATMRGLKRKNFWVMEQQAGSGGWEEVSPPPRPGELRLWAYQSIAHGADGILFFRWRTARYGCEQYWHGLMNYDGCTTRRFEEVKQMGKELDEFGALIHGSSVRSQVALLLSYDSRFAFQIQANNPRYSFPDHIHQVYRALYQKHISVDILSPQDDLSSYKLVIAPALHVLNDSVAGNLKRFVNSGGVLVVTPRTGVKDEANAVVNQPLPGLLAELCGVKVADYDSLAPGASQLVAFSLPELSALLPLAASIWCDILEPAGAEVIARYTMDYYAGKPAITLNSFGRGKALYFGVVGDTSFYDSLAGWILGLAGVCPVLDAPPELEVAERWLDDERLLFILNHTKCLQQVRLDGRYRNLLNEKSILRGVVEIPPREVLVLSQVE